MKCQFAVYLIITISVVVKCGVIKRHHNEDATGLTTDQEIKNTTGTHHAIKNDTETDDEELQESGDKRLKVPDATARKLSPRQELSQNNSKNNQPDIGNAKDATATTQTQDQPVASVDVIDEDITRASQEVAEISRLIGKPLTDSHALAMLKGILLEKIHTKLEDTKDISASSKSTEEGVNKFVAALAASKKKKGDRGEEKDDSHVESHQKSDTHKQPEAKEKTNCKDLEPTSRCEYLKSMGVCNDKTHGEVKVRCQLTCGACPDCSSCTTVDCGSSCIGYDVQAVAPPAPPPYPAPAPIPPPVPPPAPVPPPPVPPPESPLGPPPVLPPVPPPGSPPAPVPPPAPVLPVPVTPAPVLPVTTPHPHVEVAHVAEPHVHDAAGHAVVTTSAPLVHAHPSAPAALPTPLQHLVEPVTPPPPCEPIAPTVAHSIPPPVVAPSVVAPPPCKPVKPTCPPCKPEAPTCQPCEPLVPACPPPKPKPVVVAPAPPKAPPCVPVVSVKPVAVHPTAQVAETWHHHHHHAHVVATAPAVPVAGTTLKPVVVANPTTPVAHVDVNAALPVEAKPAVAPVVVNPVHKPQPTVASAPVAVPAPDAAPVAVAAPEPAPVVVAAPTPAPVAVAAPAAGTCCSADVQKCGNPVDIGIALDSSAGVRGRWSYMKNFALSMVDRFQMGNHARFGIVQFDTIAKFPVRMETYNDAETLKVHIKKLLMNPYGKRRTDEALKVARDDLFRTARAGVRRAMIIVTNGRANGDDPTINWSQLIVEPARELQEAGVEVFVIGVTSHVAPDELKIMATDPSTQHVFQVPTFDRIQTVVDSIATRICHGWISVVNALADGVQLSLGGSLLPSGTESLLQPTGPYGCKVKYAKMGCYSDDGNSPRPLPEELFTDQNPTSAMFTGHHVDYENWDQYLPSLVCRCAELTFQKGYKVFGLQLFGSCWSGAQAGQTYAIDGEADQNMCVSFGFKTCTPTDQVCVGKQQTNFVYTFDDEGR